MLPTDPESMEYIQGDNKCRSGRANSRSSRQYCKQWLHRRKHLLLSSLQLVLRTQMDSLEMNVLIYIATEGNQHIHCL